MRIFIVGRVGQVAWELRRAALPLGEVVAVEQDTFDLSRPDSLAATIRQAKPDVIINAAAYTQVDKAESEPERAIAINGEAVGAMAAEAARSGALFVHYSTDYVFDGRKTEPYLETDTPAPLGVYGRSKLVGEEAARSSGAEYIILRTSWVFASRGGNFVRTILRLAADREALSIVADQFGAPTWARYIADATIEIILHAQEERRQRCFRSELFHLTSSGQTSWHQFACRIVDCARHIDPALSLKVREILPIPTAEYPTPARRPVNSRLDCSKVRARYGIVSADWSECLELCLEELLART